jgi:hypothetical protein
VESGWANRLGRRRAAVPAPPPAGAQQPLASCAIGSGVRPHPAAHGRPRSGADPGATKEPGRTPTDRATTSGAQRPRGWHNASPLGAGTRRRPVRGLRPRCAPRG